ncbi:hypothetical protein [Halorussus amylolyticus]|uniref:hypothetical protein n=1 Tax=Halorussus amylolyticus TaxID=1126242 RepID=UPI00192F9B2D|nr:hypothetical protein [Halorussus amylolyticus]
MSDRPRDATGDEYGNHLDEEAAGERRSPAASGIEGDESDDSWLSEGAIGLVILAGVVLFFFPEPATSGIGILLILVGLAAWVLNRVT